VLCFCFPTNLLDVVKNPDSDGVLILQKVIKLGKMSLEGYYARMDSQLGIEKAITTRCIKTISLT
jgi:hypothetical protein